MSDDGETDLPARGGTVAWQATIGRYRITCSLVERSAAVSGLAVDELGQTLEVRELEPRQTSTEVHAAALGLRDEYTPRILAVAKRTWRGGGTACLTTSWGSPAPPAADSTPVE